MGYQYHMNIILCNACNPTFIDRLSVPDANVECAPGMGHIRQKKYPFWIDGNIHFEGRCFHVLAWCCAYRVALLCEKFWACFTWNKV